MSALELTLEFEAYDNDELDVVDVVKAVKEARIEEARQRIPDEFKKTHPYSALALWTYYARTDHDPPGETCPYCSMFDGSTFTGDTLRITFPDHYWKGSDIYPDVHKTLWGKEGTCACLLIREPDEVDPNLDIWSSIGTDWSELPKEEEL